MIVISLLLNLPYSLLGLALAFISGVRRVRFSSNPSSIIFYISSFWWEFGYMKNARGMALGNVVLMGPKELPNDLEHELIHVRQHARAPFVYPFLYYTELLRNGYKENKYEKEAYEKSNSIYIERDQNVS